MPTTFDLQQYQPNWDPISGGPFVSVQDVMNATSQMWSEVLKAMIDIIPKSTADLVNIITQSLPELIAVLFPTDGSVSPLLTGLLDAFTGSNATGSGNLFSQWESTLLQLGSQVAGSLLQTGGLLSGFGSGTDILTQLISAAGGTGSTLPDFGNLFTNTTAALEDAIISALGGTGTGITGVTDALTAIPMTVVTGLESVLDGLDLGAAQPIVSYVQSVGNSMLDLILKQSSGEFSNVFNSIVSALGGGNTGQSLTSMFTALQNIPGVNIVSSILASIIPGLDASKIISGILGLGSIPNLPASQTTSGTFLGTLIPGLDASKITTGIFGTGFIPGLDVSKIISGVFGGGFIPSLDASKTTTGIFGTGLIPGLDVSKIISGVFGGSFIPSLDASKVTTGQFPQSMVNLTSIAASLVSGVLTAINIPGLDVSKIVTGVFGTGFIPSLPAAQITSGTFGSGLIPSLDGSKIGSGTVASTFLPSTAWFSSIASSLLSGVLGTGLIPGLDASKIISGLFPQTQVTNLTTDLASKTPNSVFNASAQAGPNIVLGPAFEDSTIARNYGAAAGSGYSTAQKHSGTQSFKIVSAGGWDELDLTPIPGGTFAQDGSKSVRVTPGQKWYVSCWCYAESTNVGANSANMDAFYTDSTGVNPNLYTALNPTDTTVPGGVWTKISGYTTVPAGYDRLLPYFYTENPTTVGNVWYVDDADVHDETAAQNIAQNLYGSVGTVGITSPNLAPNPSFATDIAGWTFWDWGAATLGVWDGTQGHSANGSLKLPFSGGSGQSAADLTFPCTPGQSFSISLWAKQDANSGGGYIGTYTGDAAGKGFGTSADTTHNLGNAATGWTQHNYTFTAPANCYTVIIEAASQTSGAAGNLWIDDVVVQQTNMVSPTVAPNAMGDIPRLINSLFQGFLGSSSNATSLTDAATAVQKQASQTVSNTKAIQSLQSAATAGANSGTTVNVDFGSYADGPMPSVFTVTYTGTGTSRLGVTGGQANWATLNNDADVSASVRYNVAPTATDFQIIRGTMTQAPSEGGISGNPRLYVRGRVNAADNSFVWARARSIGWLTWQADIGCTVSGVETVWVPNITLPWNLNMYFKVGVGVNPRVYELWSGDQMVYSHTEVGTASQLGSSNRYWGAIAEMRKGSVNAITSGKIGATSVSDNAPVAVLGSHAHVNRTSTTAVNLTGGSAWTLLPASFFGATIRSSSDITTDLVNGKFTVTKGGPYHINARIRLSSSAAALVYLGLYKNGVLDQVSDFWWPGDTSAESIGGHFTTHLAAGDNVQLATFSTGVTVTVLTGEATGTQTYFNITRGAVS